MSSSTLEHFSHPEHPLILKEDVVIGVDAKCYVCDKPVIGSPTYTCTSSHDYTVCQNFYLHKTCAELPTQINHRKHTIHPLTLLPRFNGYYCDTCERQVKFAYGCDDCEFDVCLLCAFEITHFSHPKHPLVLKEYDVIGVDDACHKPVVGSPTYSCSSHDDDIDLENLYLSKSCTELPTQINHDKRNYNPLTLPHEGNQEHNKLPLAIHHSSHQEHPLLTLMQMEALFRCDACWQEAKDSSYVCTICYFRIHTSCAFLPLIISEPTYHHHPLSLIYSIPEMHRYFRRFCSICGQTVHPIHWVYYCHKCTYFVHIKCSVSNHITEDFIEDDIKEDAKCYGCNRPVIGSPTYTCNSHLDIDCKSFYLHKSCAELPKQIFNYHKHDQHPLTLLLPRRPCICYTCGRKWKLFTYRCDDCQFNVCMFCAFEQRELRHEGHKHTLTLMKRKAFFNCDACGEEAKDSSYACTTCEFWIHESCALSPYIIPAPAYHQDHPLKLIYSIPSMHRIFPRYCNICEKLVHTSFWLYYCHTCTYFVHLKCAISSDTVSMLNVIKEDCSDNEPDLVQFPLPSEESLFQLIITQCANLQVGFQGECESTLTISTIPDDPHIIEEHWSHKNHPLEQLQLTNISENDSDDNDDDTRVLICDGCIQPITVSHPSYYACIQCGFFLHSFCATILPQQLVSPSHPQHSLSLQKRNRFYSLVKCGVCSQPTNGFYYHCVSCDIKIDMRCAFLPTRIKHESHKHHSLVQRPFSKSVCSVSKLWISSGMEYACETCSSFQIHINCVFYPSRMKHRYDDHPITLRLPPFFYEGVFYCEICEEQVNNQWWLYHCDGCDHSFHNECLRWFESVKLGGTIELAINDKPHTLVLVLKRTTRRNSLLLYICGNCGDGYEISLFFECDGCGFLACRKCAIKMLGD